MSYRMVFRNSLLLLVLVIVCIIGHADAQSISDEAMRHFDRGQAAVEMAKSPADYEDAIREFEQAILLAPDWPDVYYNIGLIQEKVGRYDNAIRNLSKYLELSPNASDVREVKKFIAKIEYKMEKEERIKRVYEIMTSGNYEKIWITSEEGFCVNNLFKFRMVSGKMQVSNQWYTMAREHGDYHPKQHLPIPREWEPVKVNGRFYEYTFSFYMDIASEYVIRYDNEVEGEIISIDPPRVKEVTKFFVNWGAPIEEQRQPWRSSYNFSGTRECIFEWRRK